MRAGMLGFTLVADCPDCESGQLRVRTRRADGEPFLSCSRFPLCRCALPYVEGLDEVHAEMEALRAEVSQLRSRAATPPDAGPRADARSMLRDLLVRFHPDRRGAMVATLEIAQAVGEAFNTLRQAGGP